MSKPRGPVFEVRRNTAGDWFWHELAGGKIADVAQAYASKWNAKRAAKRKAAVTANATWRVVP